MSVILDERARRARSRIHFQTKVKMDPGVRQDDGSGPGLRQDDGSRKVKSDSRLRGNDATDSKWILAYARMTKRPAFAGMTRVSA